MSIAKVDVVDYARRLARKFEGERPALTLQEAIAKQEIEIRCKTAREQIYRIENLLDDQFRDHPMYEETLIITNYLAGRILKLEMDIMAAFGLVGRTEREYENEEVAPEPINNTEATLGQSSE